MSFQQLYYTSSRQGLSGFPGYQFNAATPGIATEVMRDVERLSAYEPPESLGFNPTDAQIRTCPVSLCFSGGVTAILANTTFVGRDFSGRFGNYFTHALVTGAPEREFGPVLPIETWQAPFWARDPSAAPELPPMTGPPATGPIDRRALTAYLRDHPQVSHLSRVLTAAALSISGSQRSVLLCATDATDNARWIAAISYLLPPPMVRRMSFTTYHRRPSYCSLNLVGTLFDPATDWTLDGADTFHVFDLARGEASKIEPHPLAELLVRIGPVEADAVWQRAMELSRAAPASLDDWHPPVAAAAALQGVVLAADDLTVAAPWVLALARSGRLPAPVVGALAAALADRGDPDEQLLRQLIDCGGAAGVDLGRERLEQLEGRRVGAEVARIAAGAPLDGTPAPVTSARVQELAARRCEAQLAVAGPATAMTLLAWAAGARVPVDEDAVVACGERLIGPSLVRSPTSLHLGQLATAWPGLLRGVANGVSALAAEDPVLVLQAWGGGLGDALREEDLSAHPRLQELRLLHQAERQGGKAETLLRVMVARNGRGDQTPPDDLLQSLWRAGEWSYTEASEVIAVLPSRQLQAGEIPAWLDRAIQRPPRPQDWAERSAFLRLCAQLERHPAKRLLDESSNRVLAAVQQTSRRVRLAAASKSKAPRAAAALIRRLEEPAPEVEAILLDRLPGLLLSLEPADLADLLPLCSQDLFDVLADAGRRRLDPHQDPDPGLGARLFLAARGLSADDQDRGRALTTEVLTPMLTRWSPRETDALIAQLERRDPDSASAFAEWQRQNDRSVRGRLERIRRGWGRGGR